MPEIGLQVGQLKMNGDYIIALLRSDLEGQW